MQRVGVIGCVAGDCVCFVVDARYDFGAFFAFIFRFLYAGACSACAAKQVYIQQLYSHFIFV
jgi:hypothetical protein